MKRTPICWETHDLGNGKSLPHGLCGALMHWWVLRRTTWDNMRGVCYRLLRSWRRVAHQLHASCSPLSFSLRAMWTRLDDHFFLVNLWILFFESFFHQDGHQFDVENSTWASSLCGRSAGWALMSFKVNSTNHWSEGWHLPYPVCLRHTGQLRDQCFCGWQQAAHVFVAPDEVHGSITNISTRGCHNVCEVHWSNRQVLSSFTFRRMLRR